MVGGGTVLNRMLFDRGSKADYDRWAALGNDGWDWDSLLPYFMRVSYLFAVNFDVSDKSSSPKLTQHHPKSSSLSLESHMMLQYMEPTDTSIPAIHLSFGPQPVALYP